MSVPRESCGFRVTQACALQTNDCPRPAATDAASPVTGPGSFVQEQLRHCPVSAAGDCLKAAA